jgi:hypothetical protein
MLRLPLPPPPPPAPRRAGRPLQLLLPAPRQAPLRLQVPLQLLPHRPALRLHRYQQLGFRPPPLLLRVPLLLPLPHPGALAAQPPPPALLLR